MIKATEEQLSPTAEIDPTPCEEIETTEENENNLDDEDDLHEIQVDDDVNEPDAEDDYPIEPGIDNDLHVQSMPEEDEE
jgi:hypothetical protein